MQRNKAPNISHVALGPDGTPRERRSKALTWFVGIVTTLFVIWALRTTFWVSMPLVAAFFIALAVWPISKWIHAHLPRGLGWLGHAVAMLVIFVALLIFVLGLWYAASQVAAGLPQYDDKVQSWWKEGLDLINGIWSVAGGPDNGTGSSAGALAGKVQPMKFVGSIAMAVVRSIWNIVAFLILIIFLVLLMLIEAPNWRAKLNDLTAGEGMAEYGVLIADVASAFRTYLLVRCIVGLMTAGAYAFWLWLWQLKFLIVWVLMAFLLNFVPTVGSLIAGGLAFVFALFEKDVATACVIGGGLLVIEQAFGNYVDPVMQGRNLSLSPLALLFMLLLWGWVWGVPGMLLAAPITVMIVMIAVRVPSLAPIALILSGEKSLDVLRQRTNFGRSAEPVSPCVR